MQAAQSPEVAVRRRIDNELALVCALAVCAGAIHVMAAIVDLGVHPGYAGVRLLVGLAQVLWAVALYRSPSRRLLRAGATAFAAVVVCWAVSQAGVLPGGTSAWKATPAAPLDLVAAADALLLALCVAVRPRSIDGAAGPGVLRGLTSGGGLLLVLASSLLLAAAPVGYAQARRGGRVSAAALFFCPLGQHRAHQ